MAALFTDVSGFTALAETISPSVLGAGSLTDSRLRLFCFVRLDTGLHLCHMPAPASIGELEEPMSRIRSYLVAQGAAAGRSFNRPTDRLCALVTMREHGSNWNAQPKHGLAKPE